MAENHEVIVSIYTLNPPNTVLHLSIPACSTCSSAFPYTVVLFLPTAYLLSRSGTIDSLLLVSGMAGPLNVIDVKRREWIGTFPTLSNVRHLTLQNDMLYMSRNSAGEVMTVPVAEIVEIGRAHV